MKHKTTNTNPENPCVGVGAIVVHEGRILLVKRAAEPGRGLWAIPGGRLKLGETLKECARREILEETGVTIAVGECIYVFDLIEKDQHGVIKFHFVVIDFAALYVSGETKAGDDAADAGWFFPEDLNQLAVSPHTLKALSSIGFLE